MGNYDEVGVERLNLPGAKRSALNEMLCIKGGQMQYGNTIENRNLITVKAKEKVDGVYQFRGVAYRVRDKRVTHIACSGQVFESFGNFDVEVGIYEGYGDAAIKILRSI